MRKNDKGLTLINVVLFIIIIICSIFIYFIVSEDNVASNNELAEEKRNITIRHNTTGNTNEYVELNNSITGNNVHDTTINEGTKYYYNQLNETGKLLYSTLEKNINALKTGTQTIKFDINTEDAGDYFQSAWDAFSLDRPDVFWVDTLKLSLVTKTTSNIFTTVGYEYMLEPRRNEDNYFIDSFNTQNEVENAINQVEEKINQIVNEANQKQSTFEKVEYVHDTIVNLTEYDQNNRINNSNLYGTLIEQYSVCEGYAESFKVIMDKLNIPTVIVYGNGVDGSGRTEAHAWNYVKMENDNWYAVDVTWDDPIIIGNGNISGIDRHKYFLKGINNFSSTHIEDGNVSGKGQVFKYPGLSLVDYD